MKKPPLSLLILDPSNNVEFKIPVLNPKMKPWVLKTLLINIYKWLNTNDFKRVINGCKRVPTFDVINNHMGAEINGNVEMGELRLYIVMAN